MLKTRQGSARSSVVLTPRILAGAMKGLVTDELARLVDGLIDELTDRWADPHSDDPGAAIGGAPSAVHGEQQTPM